MSEESYPKIFLTMTDSQIVNFINSGKMDEWEKKKSQKENKKTENKESKNG